jgi:hypothetical protein
MTRGRPRTCPDDVLLLVVQMRRRGWTLRTISDVLTLTGVPTPAGRPQWHPSYVCRLLQTRDGTLLMSATDPRTELRR